MTTKSEPLLEHRSSIYTPANLYYNFLLMCVSFSVNHSCVVSCLAYASTTLGDDLGGTGSGCLYVFYAFTSLLVAKPVVTMVGPKYGLLLGTVGYCVYVIGFLLAIVAPSVKWPVFLISASIGGIAGGLLWPSQGRYFSLNAKYSAITTDKNVEVINSNYAGIFAAAYLGFEMIMKVLATVVFISLPNQAEKIIFTIYAVFALAACVGIAFLDHLDEYGSWEINLKKGLIDALSAGKTVIDDSRLALLIPYQLAFGFASSFVPFYIFGTVVADSKSLGGTYVGLLSAVIVLTGTCMAIPSAWIANAFGKPVVMTTGGLCLLCAGGVLFFADNGTLGTWGAIIPYLIVYGMGRGIWENTNKAVVADLYAHNPALSTAAFSSIAFSSGLAGAIGYFTFSEISRYISITIVTISCMAGIVCYLFSAYLKHKSYHMLEEDLISDTIEDFH